MLQSGTGPFIGLKEDEDVARVGFFYILCMARTLSRELILERKRAATAEQSRGESKEETRKKKIYTSSVAVLTTLCQEEEAYAIKLN